MEGRRKEKPAGVMASTTCHIQPQCCVVVCLSLRGGDEKRLPSRRKATLLPGVDGTEDGRRKDAGVSSCDSTLCGSYVIVWYSYLSIILLCVIVVVYHSDMVVKREGGGKRKRKNRGKEKENGKRQGKRRKTGEKNRQATAACVCVCVL